MELIHIANATFSSLHSKKPQHEATEILFKRSVRLKWASKQKTFRIVKEHSMPLEHRAITRTHDRSSDGLGSSRDEHRSRRCDQRAASGSDGGASRDRTGDLLVANQTLSQLSYGPP
jgi:hypothetical protein